MEAYLLAHLVLPILIIIYAALKRPNWLILVIVLLFLIGLSEEIYGWIVYYDPKILIFNAALNVIGVMVGLIISLLVYQYKSE